MTFVDSASIFDYNSTTSGMRELFARSIGFGNASTLSASIGDGAFNLLNAESMVTTRIAPTTKPDVTIGYTSTEYFDQYRSIVRGFKVRGLNQTLAYWPDSDMTSTDKVNIREGRYTIQGALRLVANVDANGVVTHPIAKRIVNWFQGNLLDPSNVLPFDINEIYALQGVVPQCAMKVAKDSDLPVFKHYQHPQPCHCKFQVLATHKPSIPGCVACTDLVTCPSGQLCSQGYCEQAPTATF